MTEQEIFNYLKENLSIDYEGKYTGNSLEIFLKLSPPPDEWGEIGPDIKLGSVWIEIPDSPTNTYY